MIYPVEQLPRLVEQITTLEKGLTAFRQQNSPIDPNYQKESEALISEIVRLEDLLCDCVEAHGGPTKDSWSKDIRAIYARRTGWKG